MKDQIAMVLTTVTEELYTKMQPDGGAANAQVELPTAASQRPPMPMSDRAYRASGFRRS